MTMAGSSWPAALRRSISSIPLIPGISASTNASFAAWAIGLEEGRPVSEGLHRIPVLAQQIAHRLSDRAVIVDHEYGGRRLPFQKERQLPRALWRGGWGLGKDVLDVVRQLF